MELPEEVLALVFSFLSLRDRHSAAGVCRAWSVAVTHPSTWTQSEVRCESGVEVPQCFHALLPLVKHLSLHVCVRDPANRSAALGLLRQVVAGGDGRLRTLRLCCGEDTPLFYAGQDLLQGLVDVLAGGVASLTTLDLRGVPFTLSDSLVKAVAAYSPALGSLFLNNRSLVCGVTADTLREVLRLCPALSVLGAFYTSLSLEVMKDLLLPGRPPLLRLELLCDRSVKYATPLSDAIWARLACRHPVLRVDLELDHTLLEPNVPLVLQSSVPIRCLRLLTWTLLLDELELVGRSYGVTLEMLELQTPPSPALDSALVAVAMRCPQLREVHCYCVVSVRVVEAFLTHCTHLTRYTLKTRKEPHPWRCTVLR